MSHLPLLDTIPEKYSDAHLDNVCVIACQHILGTTFSMFKKMFEHGLKPENTFLIGKCYSTNKQTYERFVHTGVQISPQSLAYESRRSFDTQFSEYIDKFLTNTIAAIQNKQFDKIIVLDDGGFLISEIQKKFLRFSNITAIEQTTSGYEKIKDLKLQFPVINVARNPAKLEHESPFIAETIALKLEAYLEKYKLVDPKILIIGQGAIGKALKNELSKKYSVNGCDKKIEHCDFGGEHHGVLKNFDVIIGATGQLVLNAEDFDVVKQHALLVSASSSDREFSAFTFRENFPENADCHEDIVMPNFVILNAGFPINFNDGAEHSVAPEKIQLTRALLLEAVLSQF